MATSHSKKGDIDIDYVTLLMNMGNYDELENKISNFIEKFPKKNSISPSYAHYLHIYKRDHKKSEEISLEYLKSNPEDVFALVNVLFFLNLF